jgi:Mg-chelatase subunit ChlD
MSRDTSRKAQAQALGRWRLVLGRYAQEALRTNLGADGQRMDRALEFIYGREYAGRGLRQGPGDGRLGPGSLDPSQLSVPHWLNEVRELFPRDAAEIVEKHALDRYGLTELITDPKTLERLEPNTDLLRALLTFRGQLKGNVLNAARNVIRRIVEEIRRRLEADVRRTLSGRLNRQSHSPIKIRQNFDPKGSIRANLKNYDRERGKLIIDHVKFFARNTRRLPWRVILCIDQSGSMADSVIHSAVMAGILAGIPSMEVRLVVFDTAVVDLTQHVADPVEVLMNVQLGGGTDIAKAVRYCEQLVEVAQRTVVVLVTDFCEGGSPAELIAACKRLAGARVKLLGLASLDMDAAPLYDRSMAARLAGVGMEIAALTPNRLAEWLVKVIS